MADKNELLFQYGINYNRIPLWQKRGVGVYIKEVSKTGYNPLSNENIDSKRKILHIEKELSIREDYRVFIDRILKDSLKNDTEK